MDILEAKVLGGVGQANEVVYDIGVSDALFEGWCIPEIIFLQTEIRRVFVEPFISLTINMTLPKSPETFRWRLAISSRNGTMTVHPCLAVPTRQPHNLQSTHN